MHCPQSYMVRKSPFDRSSTRLCPRRARSIPLVDHEIIRTNPLKLGAISIPPPDACLLAIVAPIPCSYPASDVKPSAPLIIGWKSSNIRVKRPAGSPGLIGRLLPTRSARRSTLHAPTRRPDRAAADPRSQSTIDCVLAVPFAKQKNRSALSTMARPAVDVVQGRQLQLHRHAVPRMLLVGLLNDLGGKGSTVRRQSEWLSDATEIVGSRLRSSDMNSATADHICWVAVIASGEPSWKRSYFPVWERSSL